MNQKIVFFLCSSLIISHFSFAEVPILDANTVTMPKAKALNKCIDANNKVIYTQFDCQNSAQMVEENWLEQANITYLTPEATFTPNVIDTSVNPEFPIMSNNLFNNSHESGIDMLKDAMKDKPLTELFDDGIKALMMRQSLLNSL